MAAGSNPRCLLDFSKCALCHFLTPMVTHLKYIPVLGEYHKG